ncbi:MAG TPA: PHB depolymerase family esterase [Methylocella sp.]|nr:PHB depolymerase family esterase [Methylocella sp.]
MDEQAVFGSNPGNLGMFSCVPPELPKSAPLVVALHGCQQTARDFNLATGWAELGRQHGFAVLFPEQKCGNNPQNCFNWFVERHISRDDGEIASIRVMIEKMLRDYQLDRDRIFVTGLSAGGAMACALLASYPDLFAAGTIIAGLPYGAALGPLDAMKAMAFGPSHSSRELGNLVRRASPGQKKWPKVSIWHGSLDDVVAPANASALVQQWLDIHQVDQAGAVLDEVDGQLRMSWRNGAGSVVVEHYMIDGMAHGVPIDARSGTIPKSLTPLGLETGVSSTIRIAKSWGILRQAPRLLPEPPPERHSETSFSIWDLWSRIGGASG